MPNYSSRSGVLNFFAAGSLFLMAAMMLATSVTASVVGRLWPGVAFLLLGAFAVFIGRNFLRDGQIERRANLAQRKDREVRK